MKTNAVKIGVVGLGRGRAVISEVADDENVILRAICDKNKDKLQSAKEYFENERKIEGLLCFESYEDFLLSDIDAVYIATDAVCHVPFVKAALNAGKHVISEIPAISTVEEAKELKEAVKSHPDLKYMTGENCVYWAFIQAWKMLYDEGRLGEAVFAEAEYLHSKDFREFKAEDYPAEHWRQYSPAIKYITHSLGPLLYILNDRCVSVSCMEPDIKYNPYKNGAENGVAIFKTAKGAVIKIYIGFGAYFHFDHNFSIYGTKGTIETDKTKPVEVAHSFAHFSDTPGAFREKIDIPVALAFPGEDDGIHGGADKKMMRAFIKCIIEDTKPPIDVDLGISMTIPGIIAHESAVNGGKVMKIPKI